jgi:site-specific DNA recombinase
MEVFEKKTGVIYARVSSAEQVQGTSLVMQERLCREYAAREQIEVLACFVEEGESAKTANRTEFQKALAFCADKKRPVGFFIVHKLDRFARNQDDHVSTQAFLKKYGTKLRSVSEQIDESPIGKMMEGVLSTFAQFDNDVRASRSKSGMIEKVKRGEWVWAAPIGYKRLIKGGNLVVDEDKAPYIRLAFEEWAKGEHSFRSLNEFLFQRGFRTRSGKKACMQLIEKIVHRAVYSGNIRAFGIEVRGQFPPLISEELFWKCQPGVRRSFGAGKRAKENPDFPLRRFVNCAQCGGSLTGSISTNGHTQAKYPYYHHQKQGCPAAVSFSKSALEQSFIEFLGQISPRHSKYEKAFKAIVIDMWQSNYKKLDAENARVRKEIEVLEVERQRIFDLHRSGTYTDEEFLDQKERVNVLIEQKKRLLEEKRVEEFDMEVALNYCFEFVRDSAETWRSFEDFPALRARFQSDPTGNRTRINGLKSRRPNR